MWRAQFPHFIHADIFQIAIVIPYMYMSSHLRKSTGTMHAEFRVSTVASGQRVHAFAPDESVCFIKSLIYSLSV